MWLNIPMNTRYSDRTAKMITLGSVYSTSLMSLSKSSNTTAQITYCTWLCIFKIAAPNGSDRMSINITIHIAVY